MSDIHLGEDLAPQASPEITRSVAIAERALAQFVAHLVRWRVDGRPWKLVVNGDLIDMMSVPVPGEHGSGDPAAARSEDAALLRLTAVVARHPQAFAALGRFVAAGNQLAIIAGNHDRELAMPLVAASLTRIIAAAAGDDRAASRIAVHPWFVYEPGMAWIEHGHQYDEACSYEFGLAPTDPKDGALITNVDFAAIRYLRAFAADTSHGTDEWSLGGYVSYAWNSGLRGFGRLVGGYSRFNKALLGAARRQGSSKIRPQRWLEHQHQLEALSQRHGVSADLLREIDGLRATPVTASLCRLASVLMIDRVALWSASAVALLGLLAIAPWLFAAPAVALVATTAHLGNRALARARRVDQTVSLATVPRLICERLEVPHVVLGHSHEAASQVLPGGGTYLNSGTWMPAIKPGLLRAFTHVLVVHTAGGVAASLRQWRDGASHEYLPDPSVARSVAASVQISAPQAKPLAAGGGEEEVGLGLGLGLGLGRD